MIPRLAIFSLTRGKKPPKEEVREEGGYVRRGSEYQQASDWHHEANSMMGTKTDNFLNNDDDAEKPDSPSPTSSIPKSRKSKEELSWNSHGKNHAEDNSTSEPRVVRRNSLLGHNTANLMSIWTPRKVPAQSTQPTQPCIVQLKSARNLPVMGSEGDGGTNPFVTMKIVPPPSAKGRVKGEMRRWPYKTNTSEPIWNKTRDLGRFREGDSLAIEIHHHGKGINHSGRPTFLTTARQAPVFSQLLGGASFVLQNVQIGHEYSIVLKTVTKGRKVEGRNPNLPVILTLQLLPPPGAKKTVFIIRHAESKWNRAQRRHDLAGLANVDHGLSQAGREQAEALWRRLEVEVCTADLIHPQEELEPWYGITPVRAADMLTDETSKTEVATRSQKDQKEVANDISRMWHADEIWVSPLTRTIQTALVALQGHPTLRTKGFTLAADAREIKGIGGLDSIGVAKGEEGIRSRVEAEFLDLYSHKSAQSDTEDPLFTPQHIVQSLLKPRLDAGDASDDWWTGAFNSDKTEDVDVRLNELLNSIKFAQSSSLILVSHSNLFRALLGRRLSNSLRKKSPELCKEAAENKMKNCAVVRLEIDFSLDLSQCITELTPILCDEAGVFEASKEKKEKGLSSRSRHSSSPPRASAPASSFATPSGVSRPVTSREGSRGMGRGLKLKTLSLREGNSLKESPVGLGGVGQKPAGQFSRSSLPVLREPDPVDVAFPPPPPPAAHSSPRSPQISLPGLQEDDEEEGTVVPTYSNAQPSVSYSTTTTTSSMTPAMRHMSDDESMGFGSIYGEQNEVSPKQKRKSTQQVKAGGGLKSGNEMNFSGDNPFSRLSINSDENPLQQRRVSNLTSEDNER